MMMLKFKNSKIDISISFVVLFLGVMGFVNAASADNKVNGSDAKMVFNSLESFQISCFAGDSDTQQEPNVELMDKLVNWAILKLPEQRIGALSQLAVKGIVDAGVAQKILQTAIRDKDPNVRGQAVYAIAQQECADFPILLEQAMSDSELPVRIMAVDSLGADEKSINLLEQALNDDEEAVRELAAMKLESLSNTHKNQ